MDLLIPLKIRNIPASLEIRKGAIDLIGLRISGRKRTLREIAQDKIMASFDLSNGKAGENIIRPTKENINLPSEVKVIRINPERIILQLEPKSEK